MKNILFTMTDNVAHIELARQEKLNALTPDMLQGILELLLEIERDLSVKALIISGHGRCFSVGADITIWSELSAEQFRTRWIIDGHRTFDAIATCRVPVIAAMQGMAFGGGLELALAADLRVAEEDTIFGLPEVSLGTVPGWGGTQRLAELIGRSRAKQMILTAERITASVAENWGLINKTCDKGCAQETARKTASEICRLAPISVQMAKRVIDGNVEGSLGATLDILSGMATQTTSDMKEGIAALREKREANFTGS